MITFLNSAFLVGLAAVGVPVLIHLLSRKRKRLVQWGAMRFLLEAATRKTRLWRLSSLLLLLLRVLVVALFVLALAQPMIKSNWFAPTGPRDVTLVIDCSMSTARALNGRTVFEKQLDKARELIDRLNEGDTVRVLLATTVPEWLTPVAVPASADARLRLKRSLDDLAPTEAGADMLRCVQAAIAAEPANGQAARVVTVLTDGQSYGWRAEDVESWRTVRAALGALDVPSALNVVDVGARGDAANLSIDSLGCARDVAGVGEAVVVEAQVKNRSAEVTAPTVLAWQCGAEALGVTTVPALEPGAGTAVRMEHVFGGPGAYEMTCRIQRGDDLPPDDVGRCVVEIVDSVPLLVIDDAPNADWLRTQTGYLLIALGQRAARSEGAWESVFEPRVVRSSDLAEEDLSDCRCVVLADSCRLAGSACEKLQDYVRRGGGLWVALGARTDPGEFNEAFYADGEGLSPLPLGEPDGDPDDHERFAVIHPPAVPHPATRLLADTDRVDTDRVRIYRRHMFDEETEARDVSVLLRSTGGSPLAVEQAFGRGRVVVQALPLGVGWSNLPARQVFVVMAHEWLWYLAGPSMTHWNLAPGERLLLALPEREFGAQADLTTPRGGTIELGSLPGDGRREFRFGGTLWPGEYTLAVQGDGGPQTFRFVVARDAQESDLSPISEAEQQTLTLAAGLNFGGEPLACAPAKQAPHSREPLWAAFLWLLLMLMVAELLVGGRVNRLRASDAPAVEMYTD